MVYSTTPDQSTLEDQTFDEYVYQLLKELADENSSTEGQIFDEYVHQLLEELEPESVNPLDAFLPATGQLPERLRPQPFRPRALPRNRQRYREVWRLFDPVPPPRRPANTRTDINDLFDDVRVEGEKVGQGRRFTRWRKIQGLDVKNTPVFMANLRKNMGTSFYPRHVFSYKLRHIENGDVILPYTNHGSPWFNSFADAERWLNEQETARLNMEQVKTPDTK